MFRMMDFYDSGAKNGNNKEKYFALISEMHNPCLEFLFVRKAFNQEPVANGEVPRKPESLLLAPVRAPPMCKPADVCFVSAFFASK